MVLHTWATGIVGRPADGALTEATVELDLRLVRYFVAVADELHFGRAAARLYVSQPALSKQIRKLEEQLGEPLLVRDSRHVTLTARGQRFYDDARRLLALADAMRAARPPDGGADRPRLRAVHEPAVADAFAREHPDVPLLEHAMDSITQLDALHGTGWTSRSCGSHPACSVAHPSGWRHRLLRLEPLVLVGPREDPKTRDGVVPRSAPRRVRLTRPSPAPTTPTASTSPRSSTTSGSR